ncbi:MAG: rRNA pseudouridine synthase [Flavobacteriia bacterium]|nr:rRNA pseudouridine synthase [Flavobacteriia bacterium]
MLVMNTKKKSNSPKKTFISKDKKTKTNDVSKSNIPSEKDRKKYFQFKEKVKKGDPLPSFNEEEIRLNKFLSNAGVASRREADVLIQSGVISINDKIITELGYKIKPTDVVKYDGHTINAEKKRYVLLNKPKGFITTMEDPKGRKTVMSLVSKACKERIYPVGRLDKDTTGLLLFTNDGDLAKKLTHPRFESKKIYHVFLNKPVSLEDLQKIREGVVLDDGFVKCDKIDYVEKSGSNFEVGIELHSGKNRVVRRIFEHLGYEVDKLDRVYFAGLTKRDLPRSFYRHLDEKEVMFLKMNRC